MLKKMIRRIYNYTPAIFVPNEEGRMEAERAAEELAAIQQGRTRVDSVVGELRRQGAMDNFGTLIEHTMKGVG